MDQLSVLLDRLSPQAHVFFNGTLCDVSAFKSSEQTGHLHVLRSGVLTLQSASGESQTINKPSLLFYPRPLQHQLMPLDMSGGSDGTAADLVCATIDFGCDKDDPLVAALPDVLQVTLADMPNLAKVLALLFEESGSERSGQKAAMDRLTEYLVILLLRHIINTGSVTVGILAGLSDTRLHRAIKAMHEQPEYPWSLVELAEKATMSRAQFASKFRDTTGITPLYYLAQRRVSIACHLLRKGERIESVADKVGYASQSAFTRVFSRHIGTSPREWLMLNREAE